MESANFKRFEIFKGCRPEPSQLLVDLTHQQTRGQAEVLVFDGML